MKVYSESDVEVMMKKKNTSSQIENLSEVDVTPENVTLSGARALAHLFLLEQDFRQVKTPDQLSKLVVSRLNGFIDYDRYFNLGRRKTAENKNS